MSVPLMSCLILALCFITRGRRSNIRQLQTPKGASYIWGHEKTIFVQEPGRAIRDWARKLGLVFRIKAAFGAPDILVLSDPRGIAHILQQRVYDYPHSNVVRPRVARVLGKGLGWVEGEAEHKRMRQILVPSLTAQNVKAMSQDLIGAVIRVVDDLDQEIQLNGFKQAIDILHWTNRVTLNVIGRIAFLYDFEGENNVDAKKILNARHRGSSMLGESSSFLILMLLRRFPILNRLPISVIQVQDLAKNTIQSGVAQEMVRRDIALSSELEMRDYNDLLTILLKARDEGRIPPEELAEHISTFMIAGQETTAHTLTFTIWQLSQNPTVQQRLREEVISFSAKEASYDDYQSRLPFMEAVLRETLRMFPSLPYMERLATKEDIIPLREDIVLADGTIASEIPVKAGQVVIIPIIAIHRLDSVWSNPDDFFPQRWLEDLPQPDKLCSGWANLLSFSDGPRSCIGIRLAVFEYKVMLTEIIRRFDIMDAGAGVTLKVASSLQPWVVNSNKSGPSLPVLLKPL